MASRQRRVAVIGAGVAGLPAIKSCLEEDLEPVCFEQRDDVGGLWNIDKEATSEMTDIGTRIYSSCVVNGDKGVLCYSDFPQSKETNLYPQAREHLQFLKSYAEHFNLRKYIRFSTRVTKLEKSPDHQETGKWRITSQKLGETDEKSEEYDFVMICIGMFNRPKYPDLPGLNEFTGIKMHFGSYFEPYMFKNKTVLVYGGGVSGGDVACDIAREAKKVYISTRRGFWNLLRMAYDVPFLHLALNRLAFETHSLRNLLKKVGNYWRSRMSFTELSLEPEGEFMRSSLSVCDDLEFRIISGKISMMPNVQSFGERSVTFQDGKTIDIDAIVLTTGFISECSFLDDPEAWPFADASPRHVQLFLGIFPPKLEHSTLAVNGKLDPYAPFTNVFELQARIASRVFSGKLSLPSRERMMRDAIADNTWRREHWGEHLDRVVLYCYQKQLSSFLGVFPSLRRIFCMFFYDPVLAWRVLTGPSIPAVYRLFGPHARWDLARKCIMSLRDHCFYTTRTIRYPDKRTSLWGLLFRMVMIVSIALGIGAVLAKRI